MRTLTNWTLGIGHPGYSAAWGSTAGWFREPCGPFVAVTYSQPDARGLCERAETFHATLEGAAARAGLPAAAALKP